MIPTDVRAPYDVREVIARLVDGSRVRRVQGPVRRHPGLRLRPHLGLSGGHPRQQRRAVLGERPEGRAFHRTVRCKRKIPLVFLQNISGFMVGGKYEAGGIAKDGAKLVTAVASAEVPKLHGPDRRLVSAPATTACAVAPIHPRFLWTWPNSRISVMGGEQAGVGPGHRPPRRRQWTPDQVRKPSRRPIRQRYEDEGNPYLRHRPPVGRRPHRPGPDPRRPGPLHLRLAERADPRDALRRVPDVRRQVVKLLARQRLQDSPAENAESRLGPRSLRGRATTSAFSACPAVRFAAPPDVRASGHVPTQS